MEQAYDEQRGTFVRSFGGSELDASLLMHDLRFLAADDERLLGTVAAVGKKLRRGNHMMRYVERDDFGTPQNAFNISNFWLISALAAIGRMDDDRVIFEEMLRCRNHLGVLSEDTDPVSGDMWGNVPQTYSMVGIIPSAVALSTPWEEAFCGSKLSVLAGGAVLLRLSALVLRMVVVMMNRRGFLQAFYADAVLVNHQTSQISPEH